ncbi:phosphotransferase family protein [Mycobacterium sp.]|uniref:phosphotransferase family protein n=1 Tax=Mycobacterium sp. TaxID=1785 RepID=UPI002BDE23BA|nr:phosphotransferase [Mycobacterium sp.]HTY31688.1 phosphotransferase [Mycobacterium sp.]
MSTRRIRSTAPLWSGRQHDVNDLPLGLIDIELSTPLAELVSDTAVVLLRSEQGPPAAVLKMARGPLRGAELRMQRRVLAELAIHHGLDEKWRELLPRILAFNERGDATMSMESYRPGVDLAEVLGRRPDCAQQLTPAALSAIAPLHRRTATFVGVDNICYLRRWVLEPLADLSYMCQRLDPRLVPEIDRVGVILRRALFGRRLPVSWTHGDFTPGNVRVAGPEGPVTGIVDWSGGRPGRPALIDEYLMVLSASCLVEQADLGAIVAERLRVGGLSDCERDAIRAAKDQSDAEIGDQERGDAHVDERVAILLTWLHRAVDLWRRRATHPNQHLWWATNVAPVLEAVAARHGFDISNVRAHGSRGANLGNHVDG